MWAAGSLRSPASLPAAKKFHWSGGAAAHPRAENFLRGVGSRRGSLSSVDKLIRKFTFFEAA